MRTEALQALPLLCAALLAACGSNGDAARPVAIVTAFPAELGAVLAHATVDETRELDGQPVRLGRLAGVPVVMAMTGIGMVNAARTTAALLDAVPVRGVIVSGVAGSPYRIGDVVVPAAWDAGGETHAADAEWLALARRLADISPAFLARCARVPSHGDAEVCLDFTPAVIVGGRGESGDPFGDRPFVCQPGDHPVFGCDIPLTTLRRAPRATAAERVAIDMETAAIAREAQRRGLPYIAFRAVSDGAEDPLDLPGFPAQFFAYYPLAAHNAAAATAAFVGRLDGDRAP